MLLLHCHWSTAAQAKKGRLASSVRTDGPEEGIFVASVSPTRRVWVQAAHWAGQGHGQRERISDIAHLGSYLYGSTRGADMAGTCPTYVGQRPLG